MGSPPARRPDAVPTAVRIRVFQRPGATMAVLVGLVVLSLGAFAARHRDVHWGGLVAMATFYAIVFFVGVRASGWQRAGRTFADHVLAGRRLPLWIGVCTMTATWVGGGYISGTAEAAYAGGMIRAQAPWGYGLSLIVGGLWFAPMMRRHGFTTMLDPLDDRFGRGPAAILYLPALTGEIFWSAAILTALGTTFATILDLDVSTSIVLSAGVTVAYTMLGGLWAVALTDVVQLAILFVGLWLVVPAVAQQAGGLAAGLRSGLDVPGAGVNWWTWSDSALLLILGGIPWQVYFQRVLAARDVTTARRLSVLAGGLCMLAAVPPILIGLMARGMDWPALGVAAPEPAFVLPAVLRYVTGPVVAAVGLGALAAAVMSSVDSSILSASTMAAWNVYRPLVRPSADSTRLRRVSQRAVVLVGIAATWLALRVESVYALWFLCSDLVYCVLFPQLATALFDRRANRYGSMAGLVVTVALRLACGEALLGVPSLLPLQLSELDGTPTMPFRTLTMIVGLATIALVSRATGRASPPRPLRPTVVS